MQPKALILLTEKGLILTFMLASKCMCTLGVCHVRVCATW